MLTARKKIAEKLGLLKHNVRWDYPEMSEFSCHNCEEQFSTESPQSVCSGVDIPTSEKIKTILCRRLHILYGKQQKLIDLWELLDEG